MKSKIRITWHERLIEDKDSGNFYIELSPKVEERNKLDWFDKNEIMQDVKKGLKNGLKGTNLKYTKVK